MRLDLDLKLRAMLSPGSSSSKPASALTKAFLDTMGLGSILLDASICRGSHEIALVARPVQQSLAMKTPEMTDGCTVL